MTTPYWVQDAIFYQIFPDRFANGDTTNDPPNVKPWGSTPTIWDFQGGDLRGIIQKFDYLLDLGINAIYLNPIFLSPSNHRYNISDYYIIEPRLGDLHDFRALLEVAHSNGVHIVLDGVFNHCSRAFFAFADLLENQERSAYKDWFVVNHFPVEAFNPGEATSYQAWWGFKSLPKFNTHTLAVREYIYGIARFWIEQGIDGWRLDVPNEIDDDLFWEEFRKVVKSANRDAYLLGEIWTADPRWAGPKKFDGLMNYPLREAIMDLLSGNAPSVTSFIERIEKLLALYPRENLFAMYNPLGSHDTERIRTKLGGNLEKVKQAFSILFSLPGAPAIYYGDEIGLTGGKDPECRGAFPWEPARWETDLHAWVKKLITIRKRTPALRRGQIQRVLVDESSRCFGFSRKLGDQTLVALFNASPVTRHLHVDISSLGWDEGQIVHDFLDKEEYFVANRRITVKLPEHGTAWVG